MVNTPMCYSNPTIVNMYWHYRKFVYKIIINGGGYRITYFVAGYTHERDSLYIFVAIYIYIYSVASYKISYSVATSIYDNFIY